MNLDVNGKAFNLNKGIVTQNIQSEWKILCDDDGSFDKPEVANEICQVIGFRFDCQRFIAFCFIISVSIPINYSAQQIHHELLNSHQSIEIPQVHQQKMIQE